MPKPLPFRRRPDAGGGGREGSAFGGFMMGSPIENRRQLLVKLCWMALWMAYLVYPLQDLTGGRHGFEARVAGAVALTVFVGGYLGLVAYRSVRPDNPRFNYAVAGGLFLIAVGTALGLGSPWLALFTYTSVCAAVVFPPAAGLAAVSVITAGMLVVGWAVGAGWGLLTVIVLPCFLSGVAMTGLQRLVATMRELREARAAVAQLAASEERLRLARDLHDLLGHSLSLITLKSELAGRLLDQEQPGPARGQVADIEKVARQSLIDVREAVSGFRRPTLPVELAAARTALGAARITLEADPSVAEGRPGLGPEEAGALAWALRESVTNIVRHAAGATVCTVTLDELWEGEGGRRAVLEITDNGRGAGRSAPGNGLSGLGERLALVDGRLETGPGPRGRGFRLRAVVPVRAVDRTPPVAGVGRTGDPR